ncbi:CAMK/CAMKL protein kinase [Tremella mesenterica]|uniref:CAMK/CAMKL protein kinase n=1 Tax=Tremella mesenterica TaxID=5217 RepID=A0A4V1M3B2_TREME|nr:CAMK/CAMKL protein kinase [Tremella mesenterica]
MVGLSAQPTLYKPKSKIRLRLGLTPPHPKPAPAPVAQITTHTSQTTVTNVNTNNSTVSLTSRPDSRSAFTYDSSVRSQQSPAFDVISYSTQSPASLAFSHHPNPSTQTLADETVNTVHAVYPSPPTTDERDDTIHATAGHGPIRTMEMALESHPHVSAEIKSQDVFHLSDEQLSERFVFVDEIGFGNWGSVWKCQPRRVRESALTRKDIGVKLGKVSAAGYGGGARGVVAIKLVHRSKDPTTAARVRALWGEMKIIRGLRHEPHPSIIQFEAFVITPSYALVIMPYLSHLIPVCLPPQIAIPYFRQLASAVGYLHERGITHNDIKPANVLLGYNDVPVLVDFGFAQKWQVGARGSFLSSISWGTPEYLDPQRAKGMPHDERASDVWSLGITMFEILIGRTPFEANEEEEFFTPEQLIVYYERTKRGVWVGDWSMPSDLEELLRAMINPDPTYRLTAMQAYHHHALQPSSPSIIVTPHFVRMAATFDDEPLPAPSKQDITTVARHEKSKSVADAKKKRKTKEAPRAATPIPLGESIKQHANLTKGRSQNLQEGKENMYNGDSQTPSPQKNRLKQRRELGEDERLEDDLTPTKLTKPAQPLQLLLVPEKRLSPRTSQPQLTAVRPASAASDARATPELRDSKDTTVAQLSHRVSAMSLASSASGAKTKEEAVLRTMRSLEGIKKKPSQRDLLSKIGRPAPEPPRPRSMDSIPEEGKKKSLSVVPERHSVPIDMLINPLPKIELKHDGTVPNASVPTSPPRKVHSPGKVAGHAQSPVRHQVNAPRPADAVALQRQSGITFPKPDFDSPLAELRERILTDDQEKAIRFRQHSGDLLPAKTSTPVEVLMETKVETSTPEAASRPLSRAKSIEALALDNRLDKITAFVKNVEFIVDEARKALAEGRELDLPLLSLPQETTTEQVSGKNENHGKKGAVTFGQPHQFGVSPEKGAIPAHLRTSSTQVEPATPPKYLTYAEAEAKVRAANEWMEMQGRGVRKERAPISHVMKIFDRPSSRSNTPEPSMIPLKAPALRGAPSTPALRSTTTRAVPARKSESNLRNFATMPSSLSIPLVSDDEDEVDHGHIHRQRGVYEQLLDQTPGVVRQGDGWSSWRSMAKPSSMASLREKARNLLRDDERGRHITNLAEEVKEKRNSKLVSTFSTSTVGIGLRPQTPAAASTLKDGKVKGIFKAIRGVMGGNKA